MQIHSPHTIIPKKIEKDISFRPPGSKSLSNRALLAASLCEEPVKLMHPLFSEDTLLMMGALRECGISIQQEGEHCLVEPGDEPFSGSTQLELFLGNAGTAVRFLSSILCAKGVAARVTGSERMHQRPIGLLLKALCDLGGEISSEKNNGCPPLIIRAGGLHGGKAELSGEVSSQFFSGLMMSAPLAKGDSEIKVLGNWLSRPYIDMTQSMLSDFGIESQIESRKILIPGSQKYQSPGSFDIEPDASAATYPLALGILHGVGVRIEGLGRKSIQGDLRFVDYLEKMGCQVLMKDSEVTVTPPQELKALSDENLEDIPDAAMTLATILCFAKGKSHLSGLRNLRYKECDRLHALETELTKIGAKIKAHDDGFDIEGISPKEIKPALIETYDDHRMAMCLSLPGTLSEGIQIGQPNCVAKTYPNYWQDLDTWLGR